MPSGPRMVPADGFLALVEAQAPTRAALGRLDARLSSDLGMAPRSFVRAVTRARASGRVSVKVLDYFTDWHEPRPVGVEAFHRTCPRCSARLRTGNPGPWCSPCERGLAS